MRPGPLLALVALLVGAPALAQPRKDAPPTPAAKKEAGAHYQRGVALYKEGNYSAALSEFRAAYAALPSFEVLYNVGLSERRLFKYGQAITTFNRYLEEGGAKVPRERRASVALELEQIQALTAFVAVTVKGTPAQVEVDGEVVGTTPLVDAIVLGPGRHVVRVTREGDEPSERAIEVVSGANQALTFELAPKVDTRPVAVTVETDPLGAEITVDAKPVGRSPVTVELAPGSHEVAARAPARVMARTDVVVVAKQPRTVQLQLAPLAAPARPFPVLGVSLMGAGLLLGGGGAFFAVQANTIAREVNTFATAGGTWDARMAARDQVGKTDGIVGWGLFATGGALLAAGLFLSFSSLFGSSDVPVAATLTIAPVPGGGAVFGWSARF